MHGLGGYGSPLRNERRSTQPQPGKADSPEPMKVPAEQLKTVLGITAVNYVQGQRALAVVDSTLA